VWERLLELSTPTAPAAKRSGFVTGALGISAAALVLVSRLPYSPPFLHSFDAVNFALAIEHFDPIQHQPQPPGYPVFVALLKMLDTFLHDPNRALIASGIIGTGAGLVLVWLWASRMFGRTAACVATALLFVHPVFWAAGIVNPVRTFLVVIAAATAAVSWNSLTAADPRSWFYATSATLGLLAGFRPESLLLLFPLWLATGWARKAGARTWTIASTLLVLSVLVWLVPLLARGGVAATFYMFFDYLRSNSREYTAAFGAGASASFATLCRVCVWTFGLAVAWIWAAPFAWRSLAAKWSRAHTVLLVSSFVPPFLFYAFVHVRDVDQTLLVIPTLCVIGGAVIAGLTTRTARVAALAAAVLFSAWNFRWPMFPEMGAASRGGIRYLYDWDRSTFAALDTLRAQLDSVIVWDDSVVTWRQISYYYPANRLLALGEVPLWLAARQAAPVQIEKDAILVPAATRLILGVSHKQANALAVLPGAQWCGPLIVLPWNPGSELRIGGRLLRSTL
jgi:hypothetical protein